MSDQPASLMDAAQARANRVVFEFPVPKKYRNEVVNESVGMVKLRAAEEELASRKARNDSTKLAYELVKASIYEVDGKKLSKGDAEEETFWSNCDPKLRQLLLAAYAELHTPEDEDAENFLKGMREKVG